MDVKISTKYQIVIPKAARRRLKLKPGQEVSVTEYGDRGLLIEPKPTMEELLNRATGTMKDTQWQKEGIDAAVWLRRQRDSEWD